MIHATHSWRDHYCAHCGTLDRAVNGVPEAPCAKAPAAERHSQSHQFADLSGRCARCGAHCMSIDAKLRCVPVEDRAGQAEMDRGVTEEFSA